MFSLIKKLFQLVLFSLVVLILGNIIQWEGRTLSDQVKLRMSHPEHSEIYRSVQQWTQGVSHDAKNMIHQNWEVPSLKSSDEFTPSERQKLRALIRELNSEKKSR